MCDGSDNSPPSVSIDDVSGSLSPPSATITISASAFDNWSGVFHIDIHADVSWRCVDAENDASTGDTRVTWDNFASLQVRASCNVGQPGDVFVDITVVATNGSGVQSSATDLRLFFPVTGT
jgi:hypothetical protein